MLLNGQVPLVVGKTVSTLALQPSAGTTPASRPVKIIANSGQDVTTSALGGGQLAGLLQVQNTTLPALIGDQTQQGSLNKLAQNVADRVNSILTSGTDSAGNPGQPLFTYTTGASASTAVALSMGVDSTVTAASLPTTLSGAGNGVPNQLAALATETNTTLGSNFTDFYSKMVSNVGSQASDAAAAKTSQTDQLTQAENLRSQTSGVSLNEQAAMLMQYQQAYQAASQLISVINNLTGYLMNTVGNSTN